jgi:hypothetical protein
MRRLLHGPIGPAPNPTQPSFGLGFGLYWKAEEFVSMRPRFSLRRCVGAGARGRGQAFISISQMGRPIQNKNLL